MAFTTILLVILSSVASMCYNFGLESVIKCGPRNAEKVFERFESTKLSNLKPVVLLFCSSFSQNMNHKFEFNWQFITDIYKEVVDESQETTNAITHSEILFRFHNENKEEIVQTLTQSDVWTCLKEPEDVVCRPVSEKSVDSTATSFTLMNLYIDAYGQTKLFRKSITSVQTITVDDSMVALEKHVRQYFEVGSFCYLMGVYSDAISLYILHSSCDGLSRDDYGMSETVERKKKDELKNTILKGGNMVTNILVLVQNIGYLENDDDDDIHGLFGFNAMSPFLCYRVNGDNTYIPKDFGDCMLQCLQNARWISHFYLTLDKNLVAVENYPSHIKLFKDNLVVDTTKVQFYTKYISGSRGKRLIILQKVGTIETHNINIHMYRQAYVYVESYPEKEMEPAFEGVHVRLTNELYEKNENWHKEDILMCKFGIYSHMINDTDSEARYTAKCFKHHRRDFQTQLQSGEKDIILIYFADKSGYIKYYSRGIFGQIKHDKLFDPTFLQVSILEDIHNTLIYGLVGDFVPAASRPINEYFFLTIGIYAWDPKIFCCWNIERFPIHECSSRNLNKTMTVVLEDESGQKACKTTQP